MEAKYKMPIYDMEPGGLDAGVSDFLIIRTHFASAGKVWIGRNEEKGCLVSLNDLRTAVRSIEAIR